MMVVIRVSLGLLSAHAGFPGAYRGELKRNFSVETAHDRNAAISARIINFQHLPGIEALWEPDRQGGVHRISSS